MIRDFPRLPLPEYAVVAIGCASEVPAEIAGDLRRIGIPDGLIGYEYQPLTAATLLSEIGESGLVVFGTSGLFGRLGIDVASSHVVRIPKTEATTGWADDPQKSRDLANSTGNTDAMTVDREALQTSWNRTREHLDAARAQLAGQPDIDLSATLELLEHNELGLAFDCLVDLGDDLDLPLAFWQHLDQAAREMRLYSDALHKPHLTAADLCRRHLAAASERE